MASTEEDVKPCLQRTSVEELADKPLLPVDDDFPFRKLNDLSILELMGLTEYSIIRPSSQPQKWQQTPSSHLSSRLQS